MIKVVIVENRTKNELFEAVFSLLKSNTKMPIELVWIVQSHAYHPKLGRCNILPYPKKNILSSYQNKVDDRYQYIISSKRSKNLTGKVFNYYQQKIKEVLLNEQPDLVFGEATLFHELTIVELCKDLKIPYVVPATSRYPGGRFSFYCYDTMKTLAGSGAVIDEGTTRQLAADIINRKVIPDYMKSKTNIIQRYVHLAKVFVERIKGEKYNTPSLIEKINRYIDTKIAIKYWIKHQMNIEDFLSEGIILYPMQMQPESNIDVYGRKYRDQYELIKELLSICKELNYKLAIKANPKAKDELTPKLIKMISSNAAAYILPIESDMLKILKNIDLVITVTGTVAYECLLAKVPVITLGQPLIEDYILGTHMNSLSDLKLCIQQGNYKSLIADDCMAMKFLQYQISSSYPGHIGEKVRTRNAFLEDNLKLLSDALMDVFSVMCKESNCDH